MTQHLRRGVSLAKPLASAPGRHGPRGTSPSRPPARSGAVPGSANEPKQHQAATLFQGKLPDSSFQKEKAVVLLAGNPSSEQKEAKTKVLLWGQKEPLGNLFDWQKKYWWAFCVLTVLFKMEGWPIHILNPYRHHYKVHIT